MFLRRARQAGGEATPKAEKYQSLVGKTGTVETPLRPTGTIRVEGLRVDARAESDMIEKGRTVKVIKSEAMDVIVRLELPQS